MPRGLRLAGETFISFAPDVIVVILMKPLLLAIAAFMLLASPAFCAQGGNQGNSPDAPAGQQQGDSQGALVAHQQGGSPAQPSLYGQGNGSEEANEVGTGQERAEMQSGQETGRGETLQAESQVRNEGEGQALAMQQRTMLNQSIASAQKRYEGEISSMPSGQAQAYQNQNRVRVAVQALISAENVTGIGRNVSAIAREFDNSIQATLQAEEKVQRRSGIERFLFGGDEQAAGVLEEQALQNGQRIMEMQQLVAQCQGCDAQVQAMLQEQLQEMEQEQDRLSQLAQSEKQDRGIFGWLWK